MAAKSSPKDTLAEAEAKEAKAAEVFASRIDGLVAEIEAAASEAKSTAGSKAMMRQRSRILSAENVDKILSKQRK